MRTYAVTVLTLAEGVVRRLKREKHTSDVGAALAEARRQLRPAPFGHMGPGAGGAGLDLARVAVRRRPVPRATSRLAFA